MCIFLDQLSRKIFTNAVNLQASFTKNKAIVAIQAHVNQRPLRVQRNVIFLYGLELCVHKESNIVHKKHYLIRPCNLEERNFCLKWEFSHCKIFLNIISFILLFVGTNDVCPSVS